MRFVTQKKFSVETIRGYVTITVIKPWKGANENYTYILVPKGEKSPDIDDFKKEKNNVIQTVQTPIENIVCTSTTHIPLLDFLGETASLAGFPGTAYISSEKARALVDAGDVVDIGTEASLNVEKLLEINPQAVMDYAMQGEHDYIRLARKAGISVLLNADYLEESPLGRAEWIKFMALFYNKYALADSIFNRIAANYDSLKSLANKSTAQPTVFSGIMYGDTWFLPGGENSGAKFIKDANGKYLWDSSKDEGSIKLSFETVYEKAHDAEYWIGVAAYNNLKELKNADPKYADFTAFKKAKVYSYNNRMGEKGGITFFELGYMRPDLILADLIKILHPTLLPDYDLYFYKQLE